MERRLAHRTAGLLPAGAALNKLTQDIMDRCGCSQAVALRIQDQVENVLDLSECSWEQLNEVIDDCWVTIQTKGEQS